MAQRPIFTFGVPVDIYTYHRSTYRSDRPYHAQGQQYTEQFLG